MSAENGDLNWTEILRQAGGPQNLSPIATAQVFLLSAMLREERKRMETSNGSNGAINSVEMERLTADPSPRLCGENTNSPPRHSWPSKEEANQITQ